MKKQIILVVGLLIYVALQAQEKGNYLDLSVGGGIHNLSYNLQNGTEKGQFGYTLNAGYSYFFTPKWGLRTGVGFQSFNSLSTINYLSSTPDIDTDGQLYQFKANYTNWQEKQQALFINIPLTVQFKLPVSKKFGLLTSVGGQVSIPVDASYKTTGGQFVTTGFYEQYNVELSGMPQHGFSTFTNSFKGNTSLRTSYMATADLGGLYKLTKKVELYIGAYINYGLNNILKATDKLIYQPDGTYNGIFASTQTNKVNPIAFGLKVGVYWHLGKNNSTLDFEKPTETIEPVVPIDAVQSNDSVKTILPTEPEKEMQPTETVPTVVPIVAPTVVPTDATQIIQPIEEIQLAQPKEAGQDVHQKEITKSESPLLEPATVDKTPVVVNNAKEEIVLQPEKAVINSDSSQIMDSFEKAKKIAATMNLMFGFNSYQVISDRNDNIKELSDILKSNPYIHLRFVGHTCNIGTHIVNMILGMKRAINVKQKFIEQGVPENQLTCKSKAYDQPLVPNNSKSNRAKNRRVEIKVYK